MQLINGLGEWAIQDVLKKTSGCGTDSGTGRYRLCNLLGGCLSAEGCRIHSRPVQGGGSPP